MGAANGKKPINKGVQPRKIPLSPAQQMAKAAARVLGRKTSFTPRGEEVVSEYLTAWTGNLTTALSPTWKKSSLGAVDFDPVTGRAVTPQGSKFLSANYSMFEWARPKGPLHGTAEDVLPRVISSLLAMTPPTAESPKEKAPSDETAFDLVL